MQNEIAVKQQKIDNKNKCFQSAGAFQNCLNLIFLFQIHNIALNFLHNLSIFSKISVS